MGNYRAVELKDCYNGETYTIIMLNKKHSVSSFQEEINRARQERIEDINKYGDDWAYISEAINNDFDWFELEFDDEFVEY